MRRDVLNDYSKATGRDGDSPGQARHVASLHLIIRVIPMGDDPQFTLRHRGVKSLPPNHTAGTSWSWYLNSGTLFLSLAWGGRKPQSVTFWDSHGHDPAFLGVWNTAGSLPQSLRALGRPALPSPPPPKPPRCPCFCNNGCHGPLPQLASHASRRSRSVAASADKSGCHCLPGGTSAVPSRDAVNRPGRPQLCP